MIYRLCCVQAYRNKESGLTGLAHRLGQLLRDRRVGLVARVALVAVEGLGLPVRPCRLPIRYDTIRDTVCGHGRE